MLTIEYLKSILHYDPNTGIWRWLQAPKFGRVEARDIAGSPYKNKQYWCIKIKQKKYAAHRLAWFYMTGEWPEDQIDHINRDGLDNRWNNLRPASNRENQQNRWDRLHTRVF